MTDNRERNRYKFANRGNKTDSQEFDYELGFNFLKEKDPDVLKVIMKKMLRKAGYPFRDFDASKQEYFDKLPEYSDERIEYEEMIQKACEDYIEDIDPEEYDRQERQRRNMNNYLAGMMFGLIHENDNLAETKKMKYTKKQITEAIAHWKNVLESMQLNESVFDRATLLRDFNTNLSYLDKALVEKTKYDLKMIKSMIEELPDTHVDSYEGKKVPLENQFAYAIVGLLKTLAYCDATTRKSLSEADSENPNDEVDIKTDAAKKAVCDKVYSMMEDIVGKLDDTWLESDESAITQGSSFTVNATRNNSGKWYGGFHSSSREEPDEEAQVVDYEIEPYDGTYMDEDDVKKLNDIGLEPEWQDENEIAYEVSGKKYDAEYMGKSRFGFSYDLAYKFNVIDIKKFATFINAQSI